jgi:hypothetical protein
MDNKYPLKIYREQLPKKVAKLYKDEWIYGYFLFFENSDIVHFMNGDMIIFECTRPFQIASTHLLVVYGLGIIIGFDNTGKNVLELSRLTVHFNNY